MEIQGKIIAVLERKGGVSKKSGEAWASQEYVIETVEQYPKRCLFNVFGEDKIKEFNIQLGCFYNVKFDINAREYNGRWYNEARAWKVEPQFNANPQPMQQPVQQNFQPAQPAYQQVPQQAVAVNQQTQTLPF